MNKENFLKAVVEQEMEATGQSMTDALEALASWVGVGKSTVWHWWAGTRVPSAAARKLLRIRAEMSLKMRKKVESL